MPTSENMAVGQAGLAAGTLIHTPEGMTSIELLRPDDRVLSQAPDDKSRAVEQTVMSVLRLDHVPLVHIVCESGSASDCLLCSREQLFWVEDSEVWAPRDVAAAWIEGPELYDGAHCSARDGRRAAIVQVAHVVKTATTGIGFLLPGSMDQSTGAIVDLRSGVPVTRPHPGLMINRDAPGLVPNDLDIGTINDPRERVFRGSVYSIVLESGHTFYAGKLGLLAADATRRYGSDA